MLQDQEEKKFSTQFSKPYQPDIDKIYLYAKNPYEAKYTPNTTEKGQAIYFSLEGQYKDM